MERSKFIPVEQKQNLICLVVRGDGVSCYDFLTSDELELSRVELKSRYVFYSGKPISFIALKQGIYLVKERDYRGKRLGAMLGLEERGKMKARQYYLLNTGSKVLPISRGLFSSLFRIRREDLEAFKAGGSENWVKKKEDRRVANVGLNVVSGKEEILRVVAQVIDDKGSIIGFMLRSGSGKVGFSSKAEVVDLIGRGIVKDLVLATREDSGKKFLRGNGFKISDLPKVMSGK